jgi:hypothetical protein
MIVLMKHVYCLHHNYYRLNTYRVLQLRKSIGLACVILLFSSTGKALDFGPGAKTGINVVGLDEFELWPVLALVLIMHSDHD